MFGSNDSSGHTTRILEFDFEASKTYIWGVPSTWTEPILQDTTEVLNESLDGEHVVFPTEVSSPDGTLVDELSEEDLADLRERLDTRDR